MLIVRITALEYFSSLVSSSRLIIIFITNMKNTTNMALRYQVITENGLKKIVSLISFVGVDSSMKQGLQERDCSLNNVRLIVLLTQNEVLIPNRPRRADQTSIF